MSDHIATLDAAPAANRFSHPLAVLAAGAPLAYLLLLGLRPYAGDVVLKTSMCVLLAVIAWRAQAKLLAAALLFSAAGDAFLGIDGDRLFVPGLASFLITHVLYAAIFARIAKVASAPPTIVRKVAMVAVPLFAVSFAIVLWPALGSLAVPVALYMIAIVTMALLSLRIASWSVPAGAVLFVASDSLIALGKFLWDAAWISPAIWITYALAQLLIVYGLVANPQAPPPDHASHTPA
jgi:uncharacterized membrane protein YhhN